MQLQVRDLENSLHKLLELRSFATKKQHDSQLLLSSPMLGSGDESNSLTHRNKKL